MFGKDAADKSQRRALTRDEILNKNDVVTEWVYVPVWEGHVLVKSMTGEERDNFERNIVEYKGSGNKTRTEIKDNVRARMVAQTVVDPETMKPIFAPADIKQLGKKNASALDVIFEAARRLSRVGEEDIEELVKNSEEAHSDGSISN